MVPCTCAGNVEQLAFCVVNLFEIRVVRNRFDPLLQRNHLVVTRHYDDGAELQALGQMHGADRSSASRGLNVFVKYLVGELRILDRRTGSPQFGSRSNKDADFVWDDTL